MKPSIIICSLVFILLIIMFTGCVDQEGIYFDGVLAENLNVEDNFDIIPGYTVFKEHTIENKYPEGTKVSFEFEAPEGLYCSVWHNGSMVQNLSLQAFEQKTITVHYKADEYLKSGSYHTIFWVLSVDI